MPQKEPAGRLKSKVPLQPLTGNAEMLVVAAAQGATEPAVQTGLMDATFNVDFFDFPMIDNSRLPDGHRYASCPQFEPSSARVGLLYFPGSRASLRTSRSTADHRPGETGPSCSGDQNDYAFTGSRRDAIATVVAPPMAVLAFCLLALAAAVSCGQPKVPQAPR
jgi:hypothetical protein